MSVTIHIPQFLQPDTDDIRKVNVEGGTVGEALNNLVRQFPRLKFQLIEKGKLHGYLDVFVNKKSAYPEELSKPIVPGDELHIVNIIVGG